MPMTVRARPYEAIYIYGRATAKRVEKAPRNVSAKAQWATNMGRVSAFSMFHVKQSPKILCQA